MLKIIKDVFTRKSVEKDIIDIGELYQHQFTLEIDTLENWFNGIPAHIQRKALFYGTLVRV